MSDLCQIVAIGRLTQDCKVQTVGAKATPLATFTLAYNTGYGQYEKSNFLNVELWGKSAQAIGQYLTKGRQVAVTGTLENKAWTDDNGLRRDKWTINTSQVTLLGGGGNREEPPAKGSADYGLTPDYGNTEF